MYMAHSLRRSATMGAWLVCLMIVLSVDAADPGDESVLKPGIWGIDFSPDGKFLAAGTNLRGVGGPIVVWDTTEWTPYLVRPEEKGGLHVDFSPDGSLLAYSTRGTKVYLVDMASRETVQEIDAHNDEVFCVTFTPDGESLITCSSDRSVKMWDVATGTLQRTFEGHGDSVDGVAVSPDGKLLLSGCNDRLARLWDLEAGEVKQTFGPRSSIIRRVSFSRDGKYFLVSSWDGKSRVHETDTGVVRIVTKGGSDSADLTADNRYLATVGWNNMAHAFRVNLGEPTEREVEEVEDLIGRFEDDDYDVRQAASARLVEIGLVAEPLLRAAMESDDAEVRIRSRRAHNQVRTPEPIATLEGHAGDIEYVRFSPDDKLLATGCRGGDLKIWTVPEFELVRTLHAPAATD